MENGIQIKNYHGDKTDNALPELLDFLMKLKDSDDVRIQLQDGKKWTKSTYSEQ